MTLAKILLTLAGVALGIAAAVALGLGALVCINYIENILNRTRK